MWRMRNEDRPRERDLENVKCDIRMAVISYKCAKIFIKI